MNLSEENECRLIADPRDYVEGEVLGGDRSYGRVGVRLKGSGSFQSLEGKPSFTVKFNEFVKGQCFRSSSQPGSKGMRKVHLINSVQDPTYLCRFLGSRLFSRAGLPVAQVAFARVRLGGKDLGLYLLEEGITKGFLDDHFGSSQGQLYEGSGQDIDQVLEVDNGDRDGDQHDREALVAGIDSTCRTGRLDSLEPVLDLDRFLSFMALEVVMNHWDGYCNFQNNYRAYNDPKQGGFVFIPHGMDLLFGRPDGAINREMRGILGQTLMENPAGWRMFLERLESVCSSVATFSNVVAEIDAALPLIRPALTETGQEEVHAQALSRLLTNVAARLESVRRQVETLLEADGPVILGLRMRTLTINDGEVIEVNEGMDLARSAAPAERA